MLPPDRLHLFCMMFCLLVCAGCLGLSSNPGSSAAVTTPPTNEPAPLPTQVPAYMPQPVATTLPYETRPAPSITRAYSTVRVTPYPTRTYMLPYQRSSYLPFGAGFPESVSNSPEPSDPSAITFSHYTDPYFSVDYPSAWNVTKPGYVLFTSGSGRVVLAAEVYNFLPGFSGDYSLNPQITAVQDLVAREFPAYDSRNIIYDYGSTVVNGIPATVYSVRLPDGSVSYQRYIFVTLQHTYQFTFASDTTSFNTLARLREYMFNTLRLNDQA